jgi:hypothetical protein
VSQQIPDENATPLRSAKMRQTLHDMKKNRFDFRSIAFVVAMLIIGAPSSQASTITWTNTGGGSWSDVINWSPNSAPSTGDDAFITNSGTYDVSLDMSESVNSLTLGGSSGTQSLHTGTSVLTVNNSFVVETNGAFDLEGGELSGAGTVAVSGSFTWTGGSLGDGGPGATVSVGASGLMVLTGGYDSLYGILSNAGTMQLSGGTLAMLGTCYSNHAMLINLPGALLDFQGDFNILALCGTEVMTNFGTVLKSGSGGGGTSEISAPFYNLGLLDVESGTLSLAATYSLTNGTVNFGISSLYDFGVLSLAGNPAELGGAVSATLDGDYQPIPTNIFPVVIYASAIGGFTNTNLPYADAWQTNYSESAFSLVVLNARPMIASIPDQWVKEFTTLRFHASATDADPPPFTLTFSLSAAPPGMAIDPNSGALRWTPAQTQSPSTNAVTVEVTVSGTPPLSTNTSFHVVVVEVNVAPVWPAIGVETVNESTLLTVNDAASETNIHATITGYGLIDPPAGAAISASGIFTWTPSQAQSPSTNTITTVATNSDPFDAVNPTLAATNSFTVIVFAPTLAPIPDYTVNVGQTLTFANTAADNDPTRTLTFSLAAGPASASVDSTSGVFVWRPGTAYAGTTNTVTLRVTDNSVPSLSASQSFTVYVNNLSSPVTLDAEGFSAGQFQIQVSGPVGPDYVIEAAAALPAAHWTHVQTATPETTPFVFTDTNSALTNRFYRAVLSP